MSPPQHYAELQVLAHQVMAIRTSQCGDGSEAGGAGPDPEGAAAGGAAGTNAGPAPGEVGGWRGGVSGRWAGGGQGGGEAGRRAALRSMRLT